jgi:glutamyl-tRNA reductase
MIGCSHHTTPLEIRELLSFTDEQCDIALKKFRSQYPESECVLLNTCNRVEFYAGSDENAEIPSTEDLIRFVTGFHDQPNSQFESHFLKLEDEKAIEHLFSVASSIDSLVVGETQIASQVHQAYSRATAGGFTGPIMHAAFQHANQVAKRVTNETEIHRRRISVPSVAVSEIASEFFERFDDKQIVVIGSGEMGVETLQYLKSAGASKITIINRSPERAIQVAQDYGVTPAAWDRLDSLLVTADLVVSTTGATHPIVTEAQFRSVAALRKKGTLLILDLAVPRDFDAAIGRLPGVYLYSVDDLQTVCDRNRFFREQQLPKAHRIIREEVDRLLGDVKHRSSGATIRALRDQAEEIKQSELGRLMGKQAMQASSPEMQQEIAQAFDRLINKLLHSPLQSIRDVAQTDQRDTLVSALRKLFQIR